MSNPMQLMARLCRRYPLSTFRSRVLAPLKETYGTCIITLGFLVLFAATLLLDLGSSMLSSQLGFEVTVEPAGEIGEEAPTFGGRGNGREGEGGGEADGEHSGTPKDINQNAPEVSEEDANEEAAQPSPSSTTSPLSDNLSFKRTHTVHRGNQLVEFHTAMVPSADLISGRNPQLRVDTVRDSGADLVGVEGEAVDDHNSADSNASVRDLVRGLIED